MVVSSARKLLLEVSAGPPIASFPEGAAVSQYGANNDAPVVVVHNATDLSQGPAGTWQGAAAGDFVIINEVPETIVEESLDIYNGSNESILDVLDFLVGIGFDDQYTTSRKFWETKLSPAGTMKGRSGIMKRDDRDLARLYQDKDGVLRIVTDAVRHIEPDILLRTYRMPDGSRIDLQSIPSEKKPGFFAWLFGTRAA